MTEVGTHTTWFHFVKQGKYFAAVDEVREPYSEKTVWTYTTPYGEGDARIGHGSSTLRSPKPDSLGKLPGSVWNLTTEQVVERITKGWAPAAICIACGEGRRPIVDVSYTAVADLQSGKGVSHRVNLAKERGSSIATITGYACACPAPTAPTRPPVLLTDINLLPEGEMETPTETTIIQGNALDLPLEDESVDLIITSPPYFALRSYRDDGEHYEGQIGSEPTPQEFLEALWAATREMVRVLKPTGSIWVNLGDSYAGSGGHNNSNIGAKPERGPKSYRKSKWGTSEDGRPHQWTRENAAWLAGVLDCDGSISVRQNKTPEGNADSFVGWVRIGQMDREVIDRVVEIAGLGKAWQDGRGVWNWCVSAQQARWVLQRVFPWLLIKRRQALAVIELARHVDARKARGQWSPLTDSDIEYRRIIKDAVQSWNKRRPHSWEPPEADALPLPYYFWQPQTKSLHGLPWRYAIGCIDQLGLILRAEVIWSKPNCLSGGTQVYAKVKGRPTSIKVHDLCRNYQPDDVQLWNGTQWTQVVWWQPTGRHPEAEESYKAIRAARRRGDEPIVNGDIEIEFQNGERVGCTREHRWPTQRGLVDAADLQVGDVIEATRLPEGEAHPEALDDEMVGWFVGLYVAEGSRSGTTIQIAGHVDELERYKRLKTLAEAFHGNCAVHAAGGNAATINLTGRFLDAILDAYVGGGTAKDKHLAPKAWQRSNRFLRAVLDGYLAGDGHYEAKSDRWALGFTNNDYLASDLRTLGARLGVSVRLRRCTHTGFGKEWPGWNGGIVFDPGRRRQSDTRIVAIRQSRARQFWDIGVADEPHLFALASGVLTHNSLPESVTDRVRRSHEQWFHFVRQGKYFAAVDEVREAQKELGNPGDVNRSDYLRKDERPSHDGMTRGTFKIVDRTYNPLGKLPGSVWTVPSEPLIIPEAVQKHYDLPDHFAAFPQEWPRRIILGWSPNGVCVECGEGRRPVVDKDYRSDGPRYTDNRTDALAIQGLSGLGRGNQGGHGNATTEATITGYACACGPNADGEYWFKCGVHPWLDIDHEGNQCGAGAHVSDIQPPTTPAVVVDPFAGTGTVPMVARALGRIGIGVELSADYCRLARWRIHKSGHAAKSEDRTWRDAQGAMW